MSDVGSTPRCSQRQLQSYTHQLVRIVGKVTELRGETATIDAEGPITAHLNRESHLRSTHYAEIIGKVKPDLSIQVMQATDFGANFDYSAANAVVYATHKYPDLFQDERSLLDPTEIRGTELPIVELPSIEQDAQLLVEELETFNMSQEKVVRDPEEPELGFDGDEIDILDICEQHNDCEKRYEKIESDRFEIHTFDGEEQWVWIEPPPKEKRRKSYV